MASSSTQAERARITRMIQDSRDIYDIYDACRSSPDPALLESLSSLHWPSHELFAQFLLARADAAAPPPPHVCVLRNSSEWQTPMVATRAALQHLASHAPRLRNRRRYPVLVARAASHAVDYGEYLASLARAVVAALRPLARELEGVSPADGAEACLEALEGVREVRGAGSGVGVARTLFVEGVDRAWERSSGYEHTFSYLRDCDSPAGRRRLEGEFAVTEGDRVQRGMVERLVMAVNRLFEGGRGKVVYVVSDDSRDNSYFVGRGERAPFFDIERIYRTTI
ncbi:hypothetical protein GGS24DRAFT_181437 [Hypoxylon argillaceum]|nr:hypothetical protein GGS24DRAFT_181437 [Hypoxylon argillaceum]